jgi:hypothetical protein
VKLQLIVVVVEVGGVMPVGKRAQPAPQHLCLISPEI